MGRLQRLGLVNVPIAGERRRSVLTDRGLHSSRATDLAQRIRRTQPPAPSIHRSHRCCARLHRCAHRALPRPRHRGRSNRPPTPRRALLPPRRQAALHPPDASGVLRGDEWTWRFFLEWERRAVRPATMAARIAPYLRFFSTGRHAIGHTAPPHLPLRLPRSPVAAQEQSTDSFRATAVVRTPGSVLAVRPS